MSEAEKIDKTERRKRAEARLARSRPAREAAAVAHASRMRAARADVREPVGAPAGPERSPPLSRVEAKVLDAANEILVASGGEGQRIAELLRGFIDARSVR